MKILPYTTQLFLGINNLHFFFGDPIPPSQKKTGSSTSDASSVGSTDPCVARSCYLPPVVPALVAETLPESCTSARYGGAWGGGCVGGILQITTDGMHR